MIIIKDKDGILKMKEAGALVALVHKKLKEIIMPGVSLLELDREAEKIIKEHKAIPSFKGYAGYPNTICASVDEVVIHGIPSSRCLKEGEIISIDVGALKNGYHGDAAFTFAVGVISSEKEKLISVTEESFFKGLQMAKIGNRLGDISHAIQEVVESSGFSVVREFVGHGIGEDLHEDPAIPNYGPPGRGPRLEAGMALAIEPMVNMGDSSIEILEDKWTVVTKDRQPSAHYEHTIIITDSEPIILTQS